MDVVGGLTHSLRTNEFLLATCPGCFSPLVRTYVIAHVSSRSSPPSYFATCPLRFPFLPYKFPSLPLRSKFQAPSKLTPNKFHPTDKELVMHYLCRKCASQPIAVPIIAEIDLYKYDPWELPGKALYGEKEWYFFSPRDRKYPNGSRPNRATGTGYWKATGADKPIGNPKPVGINEALIFYAGKAPRGE
ncbi:hypothetical protein CMV_024819 [Castanea mollissima]|uniref:NAC domain-containing protein n=1 Tax=Castanea mollissima TaxID=60419 RepID=A0A8J4QG43_9ROSI|nr:hypothetical protein CMV_024819 [Castanea mollissima]